MKVTLMVLAVLLVISILLQQKESSLGSMAGQDRGEEIAKTRWGFESFLHNFTIILAVLFAAGGLWVMFDNSIWS